MKNVEYRLAITHTHSSLVIKSKYRIKKFHTNEKDKIYFCFTIVLISESNWLCMFYCLEIYLKESCP